MTHLLGIDVGTSGTKVVLMGEDGQIVASAYAEYPLVQPRPGWAEQAPEQWWQATVTGIKQVLSESGFNGDQVVGVGLSGQMHGAVLLDENYKILRPAILWCDQRTGAECEWITAKVGEEKLFEWTGNPALPGFTAPKLLWVRQHEPEVYTQIRHVLLPKDYIRYCLTGELATDVSDASGTLLFDVANRCWSRAMLAALDIEEAWLPKVYESADVSGYITVTAAEGTNLATGTPVVGGAGDQAAGAVGSGIVQSGVLSAALGTSGVVFASTDQPQIKSGSGLHAFCHAVPGKWHLMGVMLSAAASLQWFRNSFAESDSYEALTELAAGIEPGSEGLLFLPYLMGERTPYPDPDARGAFIGLNIRHKKDHLVRAVLEGVAYGLRDSLELIKELGVEASEIRVSGGGAKSVLWQQILASVFKIPVTMVNSSEGPAYGAALLAGVGVGIYPTVEEACQKTINVESRLEPLAHEAELYDRLYGLYQSLYPRLKGTMHDLTAIAKARAEIL